MKYLNLLKSRTVWLIAITFCVNGLAGIKGLIPIDWLPIIDLILGALTIYTAKIAPKVKLD